MTTTRIMTGIYHVTGKAHRPTEQERRYRVALRLVGRIDEGVTTGNHHYWSKAGVLLVKLDQVVDAILTNELMEPEEVEV